MNERFLSAGGTHPPQHVPRNSTWTVQEEHGFSSSPKHTSPKYIKIFMLINGWPTQEERGPYSRRGWPPMYANSWHNYGRKFCTLITRWWQCTCGWWVAQWWTIRTRGGCKFHTLKWWRWPVGGSLALDGRQSALLLNLYLHNVPWIGAPRSVCWLVKVPVQ